MNKKAIKKLYYTLKKIFQPRFVLGDSLHNLMPSSDLKIVDIGARGGAMPQFAIFAPYVHYYACEPDKEARTLFFRRFIKKILECHILTAWALREQGMQYMT